MCVISVTAIDGVCAAMISAVKGLPMLHQPLIVGFPSAQSAFNRFGIMPAPS